MKKTTIYLRLILTAAAIIGVGFTGCRTFRGLGQDVEHAGNHIERAAN
jgi:predicted small secreted protein